MIPWHYELFKLLFAVAVGLMVGLERELRGKPAGLRTMMLIALGSTLFTIFSIEIVGESIADRGRIAAQIVTGVGFLGAGAILHDRRQVTGLTTAASIWLVASLGIGIGIGELGTVFTASILVIIVLIAFSRLEAWFDTWRNDQTYSFLLRQDLAEVERLQALARSNGLKVKNLRIGKGERHLRVSFRAIGAAASHSQLGDQLVQDERIIDFSRQSSIGMI